jgi:hypothetical protein
LPIEPELAQGELVRPLDVRPPRVDDAFGAEARHELVGVRVLVHGSSAAAKAAASGGACLLRRGPFASQSWRSPVGRRSSIRLRTNGTVPGGPPVDPLPGRGGRGGHDVPASVPIGQVLADLVESRGGRALALVLNPGDGWRVGPFVRIFRISFDDARVHATPHRSVRCSEASRYVADLLRVDGARNEIEWVRRLNREDRASTRRLSVP